MVILVTLVVLVSVTSQVTQYYTGNMVTVVILVVLVSITSQVTQYYTGNMVTVVILVTLVVLVSMTVQVTQYYTGNMVGNTGNFSYCICIAGQQNCNYSAQSSIFYIKKHRCQLLTWFGYKPQGISSRRMEKQC